MQPYRVPGKAAASLRFDVERSTASLIDLTHARHGMPLCERHASTRTAPLGWQLVDQRTGAQQTEIWSAEDKGRPAPDFEAPTDRPATRRPVDPVSEDQEHRATAPAARRAESTPEPGAVAEEDPESEPGFHWPKQGDEHDEAEDKKEGLAAESPLLSRAFRAAK